MKVVYCLVGELFCGWWCLMFNWFSDLWFAFGLFTFTWWFWDACFSLCFIMCLYLDIVIYASLLFTCLFCFDNSVVCWFIRIIVIGDRLSCVCVLCVCYVLACGFLYFELFLFCLCLLFTVCYLWWLFSICLFLSLIGLVRLYISIHEIVLLGI